MGPFSTPTLVVLDTARLLLFLVGFALVGAYLQLRWPDTRDRPEKARVVGVALALFILAGSRATSLGGPIVWQLPASAVVFTLIAYSVLARRRR